VDDDDDDDDDEWICRACHKQSSEALRWMAGANSEDRIQTGDDFSEADCRMVIVLG